MTTDTAVLDAFDCDAPRAASDHGRLDALEHAIEHAAHYLPAQGPITVFIHHNTLHAFEDYSFDEGVQRGGRLFGCQPYLPEERYREYLRSGRIRPADVDAVLLDDLGDAADVLLGFMGTRFHFRLAMLQYPLQSAPAAELQWFIAETDALSRFRPDAPADTRRRFLEETRHWILRDHRNGDDRTARRPKRRPAAARRPGRVDRPLWPQLARPLERRDLGSILAAGAVADLRAGRARRPAASRQRAAPVRHRDLLLAATGHDIDQLVHEVLIRFCAAFLDQGLSRWPLPGRERGFSAAFATLHGQPGSLCDVWLAGLTAELDRLTKAGLSPLESIDESLTLLGVAEEDRQEYLTRDAARPPRLGRNDPSGRNSRRPGRSSDSRRKSGRVPGRPPDAGAIGAGAASPAKSWATADRLTNCHCRYARWIASRRRPASISGPFRCFNWPRCWAGCRRQLAAAFASANGRRWSRRSRRFRPSSGGGSFTRRSSGAIASRRSTRSPCNRSSRAAAFARAAVSGDLLPRRARGVVPPAPGGAGARRRDVRGGRLLSRCRCTTAARPTRTSVPALPDRHPARSTGSPRSVDDEQGQLGGRRANARRAVGHGVAPAARRQPHFAGGALLAAGLGVLASIPLVARMLFPAADRADPPALPSTGSGRRPQTHLELERAQREPAPRARARRLHARRNGRHGRAAAARHRADERTLRGSC